MNLVLITNSLLGHSYLRWKLFIAQSSCFLFDLVFNRVFRAIIWSEVSVSNSEFLYQEFLFVHENLILGRQYFVSSFY